MSTDQTSTDEEATVPNAPKSAPKSKGKDADEAGFEPGQTEPARKLDGGVEDRSADQHQDEDSDQEAGGENRAGKTDAAKAGPRNAGGDLRKEPQENRPTDPDDLEMRPAGADPELEYRNGAPVGVTDVPPPPASKLPAPGAP